MKSPRTLIRWGLISENGRGPYLAGLQNNLQARMSTALVNLDPADMTTLTASGRPYHLVGAPDPDYALATARDIWGQYFDLAGSVIRSLTVDEAVEMIKANGNTAYNRTIDEENALRRKYGVPEVVDESVVPEVSDAIFDLIIPDPDGGDDEPGRKP